MGGNTIGKILQLTTFGESHGVAVGGVLDGCPAGFEIDKEYIQHQLNRRRPGQSVYTTQRNESDEIEILSGVYDGKTTGTPIAFLVKNANNRSEDYSHLQETFRPSHADYTYYKKYGIYDFRGGGRASARETLARVAAGAIARQFILRSGISVSAYVSQIGNVIAGNYAEITEEIIDQSPVRCPDKDAAELMMKLIKETGAKGDTLGGIINCSIKGCPVGLGEPVFDKLHADLAKAMLSINAVKGFEYGSGFASASMTGTENNDLFDEGFKTKTNNSGGIQGGISNGEEIYFRVAFKPVATIMQSQESVDKSGNKVVIEGKGRHDVCVVPRAVPIVEAMAALVIADHLLRNKISTLNAFNF